VKNIPSKDIVASLEKYSKETFGADLVLDYSNFNLFFNKEIIKEKGLELAKVKDSFKEFLMTQEQVKRVYTEEEILASSGEDYFLSFIAKGFDPRQSGDIVILDKAGYMQYQETGTTHGTANSYDTHVPLLFYGWKVPKGELHAKRVITQIVPTLSQMLKIPFTNGTESEVLETLFDKK
jgi:hypothetical protein